MNIQGEHYVVVAEFDATKTMADRLDIDREGPIVWETYLGEATTREGAEKKRASFGDRYGRTRIARLVFEDDNTNKESA